MIDNLHDGAYFVDRDHRIVYWNKSAEELTGYSSEEVVGRLCSDDILRHVDEEGTSLCGSMCPLIETLADGELREAEAFLHHRSGHRIPVSIRVAPVRDRKGSITGAVNVFCENSAMVAARERIAELEKAASLDELTRLPSRHCIEQELASRADELARFGRTFGVLSVKVDGIDRIAERYGGEIADDVLRMVGSTLIYNCRPFDVVGRWEGAQFVGTVVGVERDGLIGMAERLRAMIAESALPLEDGELSVTASVGAVMAEWGDTAQVLIERAEQVLHLGGGRGVDGVTVWK